MKSLFNKLIYRFALVFNRKNRPLMIQGYYDKSKRYLPEVKISNTSYIHNHDHLILEDHVFIGHYNFIDTGLVVTIGEGCQITNFISILTHSSHRSIRYYGPNYQDKGPLKGYVRGEVNIGKYTFIGPHSTIMPGTIIGIGCIVSAYSYVDGQFPDFSIISGNPARVIGDTREIDRDTLIADDELKRYYESWAGKQF